MKKSLHALVANGYKRDCNVNIFTGQMKPSFAAEIRVIIQIASFSVNEVVVIKVLRTIYLVSIDSVAIPNLH